MSFLQFILLALLCCCSGTLASPFGKRQDLPFSVVRPAPNEQWLEGVNTTIEWTSPIIYSNPQYTFTIEMYRNSELITTLGSKLDSSLRQVLVYIPHNCGLDFAVDYIVAISIVDTKGNLIDMALTNFFGLGGIRLAANFNETAPGNIMGFNMNIQSFAEYPVYSVAIYTGAFNDTDSSLVYFPSLQVNITDPIFYWRVPLYLPKGIYHMRANVSYTGKYDNKPISLEGHSNTFIVTDPLPLSQSSIRLLSPSASTIIFSGSIQNIIIDTTNSAIATWGIDLYSKTPTNPAYNGLQIAANLPVGNGAYYQWTVPYDLPSGEYFYYIWALENAIEPSIVPLAVTSPNIALVQTAKPPTGNF